MMALLELEVRKLFHASSGRTGYVFSRTILTPYERFAMISPPPMRPAVRLPAFLQRFIRRRPAHPVRHPDVSWFSARIFIT
jgi:hypothetical protein